MEVVQVLEKSDEQVYIKYNAVLHLFAHNSQMLPSGEWFIKLYKNRNSAIYSK